MELPLTPPVKPMLAKAVFELPPGEVGELSFEPKWDGFRCIVFRDGDEVELGSRNERPLTRYFPELLPALRSALPERCVVDGEIVVAVGDRLAFDALQQRIHPAESRVTMLAEKTPAAYIAFDLLALGDRDLTAEPFRERRAALETIAGGFAPPVHLTPSTDDREVAARWFERFEGAGLDGIMAKPVEGPYVPDKRVQFKVKHRHTADCVVAGYRIHKRGDGVGSLLLGLYGDDGALHHVGVAASFTAKFRAELTDVLEPLRLDDLSEHPWSEWMEQAERGPDGRLPGAPNRWNANRDQSWEPLRVERVVEVGYAHATDGRFRGTTRFGRWRPDREPESCRLDQLVEREPVPVSEVLAAR